MRIISSMQRIALVALTMAVASAGPPLICHPTDISGQKSLPWIANGGWKGADPAYHVSSLSNDVVAVLTPSASLPLRMETLRRAAIYAAGDKNAASELTARLLARVADLEAAGKPSANAWFDAGYLVECLRQATFVYRYDMLSAAERQNWHLRGDGNMLDGKPWIERAIRLGGDQGMHIALVRVLEYREAFLKQSANLSASH